MVNTIELKVKKLDPRAVIPAYVHPGEDAGMDVTVISVTYDEATDSYIYGTGLAFSTRLLTSVEAFVRSSNYKHNFYLANHVGVIDAKGYRGEVKAIFKNRDSLMTRITNAAIIEYCALPWYKRLSSSTLINIIARLKAEFLANPLAYAPYQPGERAFQIITKQVATAVVKEVDELDMNTARGENGHGSSGTGTL